jgi:hypothetical protein
MIYSIFQFIDKRRSSHFFHHPNHTKIMLSRSPPKFHSMFCTSKDNNVTAMESRNALMSYSSINYNTSLHWSIVSSAASIKPLDESDVPINKYERPFVNAFQVLPCITFARDFSTLFVLAILIRTPYSFSIHMQSVRLSGFDKLSDMFEIQ